MSAQWPSSVPFPRRSSDRPVVGRVPPRTARPQPAPGDPISFLAGYGAGREAGYAAGFEAGMAAFYDMTLEGDEPC